MSTRSLSKRTAPHARRAVAAVLGLATSGASALAQTTPLSTAEVDRWLAVASLPGEGWNSNPAYGTAGWIVPETAGACGLPSPYLCIWHSGPFCGVGPGLVWFRATFELSTLPESISICAGVDDDIDVYVNGQLVFADHNCFSNTACPNSSVDILPYVVVGTNLVAIAGDDCAGGCHALWAAVQATFPTEPPPGDLDGDADVDLADASIFAGCLNGPNVPTPPPGCTPEAFAAADLHQDSDVDSADFAVFQTLFGGP